MNDLLKRMLSPDDDGRAFTDAVLLRAAGALYRRRARAGSAGGQAWAWLEAWARPWLIAAIVGLGLAIALPELWRPVPDAMAQPSLTADLMGATTGTSYVLAETLGN
jgi:hypothetical protein